MHGMQSRACKILARTGPRRPEMEQPRAPLPLPAAPRLRPVLATVHPLFQRSAGSLHRRAAGRLHCSGGALRGPGAEEAAQFDLGARRAWAPAPAPAGRIRSRTSEHAIRATAHLADRASQKLQSRPGQIHAPENPQCGAFTVWNARFSGGRAVARQVRRGPWARGHAESARWGRAGGLAQASPRRVWVALNRNRPSGVQGAAWGPPTGARGPATRTATFQGQRAVTALASGDGIAGVRRSRHGPVAPPATGSGRGRRRAAAARVWRRAGRQAPRPRSRPPPRLPRPRSILASFATSPMA